MAAIQLQVNLDADWRESAPRVKCVRRRLTGPPQILVSTFVVLPVGIDVQPEPHRFQIGLVPSDNTRSRVTLTFAQSIDAKIAGTGGRQLFLSGEESMNM
ncbi:hypothetical protein F5148DRAFT_1210916, partial [Russula earlei]